MANATVTNPTANTTASNAKQALANVTTLPEFTGIAGNKPVTAQQLTAWVNKHAGGNAALVNIVPLSNVQPSAANPLPFSRMQPATGKRASILWAIVNGTPIKGGGTSRTLAAYLAYSGKIGASQSNPLDLLAALNGGFSSKAKTWGTPFVKLVVAQPAANVPAVTK